MIFLADLMFLLVTIVGIRIWVFLFMPVKMFKENTNQITYILKLIGNRWQIEHPFVRHLKCIDHKIAMKFESES